MTFKDFLDIANYLNINARCFFSDRELRTYARDYYIEYKAHGTNCHTIQALIENLIEDDDDTARAFIQKLA